MLEDFLELIYKIIFEGVYNGEKSEKTPVWLRVLMAAIIVTACIALFLIFLISGIIAQDGRLTAMAFMLLFLEAAAFLYTYNKFKK